MSAKSPTLKQLGERICAHLKRLEAAGVSRFYHAYAAQCGSRVMVTYVSYQGARGLRRTEAERYLAWLDAGNKGSHYIMPKGWTP